MNIHSASNTFPLGETYMSSKAYARLHLACVEQALYRHEHGDWGDFARPGAAPAQVADLDDLRLLSAWRDHNGTRFFILTEAHRGETNVLLAGDLVEEDVP
jgi:hypothetical protein